MEPMTARGQGVEGRCDYKELVPGSFGGDGTTLHPDLGGSYTNLHVLTFIDLYNPPPTSHSLYN